MHKNILIYFLTYIISKVSKMGNAPATQSDTVEVNNENL